MLFPRFDVLFYNRGMAVMGVGGFVGFPEQNQKPKKVDFGSFMVAFKLLNEASIVTF